MINRKHISVPNILSFYRLISFPIVLYFVLIQNEKVFILLLIINLITDVLDGFIARRFNLVTEFGARIDSIADIGTYILAFTGILIFKSLEFAPFLPSFYVFLTLFVATQLLSIIKFNQISSLHLYSWKIGGYIQGCFFFILFTFDFFTVFYYITIYWGILSFCEHIVIQLLLPQMKSNQKGLYWVLKNEALE